jgi:hypothetical protein
MQVSSGLHNDVEESRSVKFPLKILKLKISRCSSLTIHVLLTASLWMA